MSPNSDRHLEITKKCPECNRDFPGHSLTCPNDGTDLVSVIPDLLVGSVFDERYQILGLLGHGGMGAVYKARHASLGHTVAIKLLHSGLLDSQDKVSRFEREGQALSSLSHLNVISAHDFGVAPGGQPYLVMHYVEGLSLDSLIHAEGGLNPGRAAGIFSQICDALMHAHKRSIVHRDLKPANILLVEEGDNKDIVKIVDFGFAKFLPDSGFLRQRLTQTGHIFGSPSYMSPEQWSGRQVDTRSDIYSLGCVMYETLCGKLPYELEELLSVMLEGQEIKPKGLAEARPCLQVSPELERVVFKAMAVSADQRYQSISELKQDLEQVPEYGMQAGEDRSRIGQKKLTALKGKKLAISGKAPAVVAAVLAVSVAGIVWYGSTESGAFELARTSLLVDRFFYTPADPRLIDEQKILADLYVSRGKYDDATREYEAVVSILRQRFGEGSAEVGDLYDKLAEVYSRWSGKDQLAGYYASEAVKTFDALGQRYLKRRQIVQAVSCYRKAVRNRERLYPDQPSETAQALRMLAVLQYFAGDKTRDSAYYLESERSTLRALEIWSKAANPDRIEILLCYCGLATCYIAQQEYAKAERAAEMALTLAEPMYSPTNSVVRDIVGSMDAAAQGYFNKGEYANASRLNKRIVVMRQKAGPGSADLGQALFHLGSSLQFENKPAEAEAEFHRALAITEKARGPDATEVALILQSLASCQVMQGKNEDALKHFERTVKICRKIGIPIKQLLGISLDCYARTLKRLGRADEAAKIQAEARQASSSK